MFTIILIDNCCIFVYHYNKYFYAGKGNEDKRGQSVEPGIASKCWLYLNGHPVRCNRFTEVASIVSAINPSLNVNNDAMEVALLQQQLLWLLYDKGHLSIYPMAIGLYSLPNQ